jgi:hypothetical protein
MFKRIVSGALACAAVVGLSAQVTLADHHQGHAAAKPKAEATGSTKARKSRGAEAAKPFNAAKDNAKVTPPMGKKSRGDVEIAWVKVRNKTDKFAAIYINGKGYSVVSWFGENKMPVPANTELTLEAKAEADDGSAVTWGPQKRSIDPDGTYTWELTE